MAKRRAWKWARGDHRVAEDLEMAGWCGYLEADGKPEPHRMRAAACAMVDEWVKWRYGHSRATRKYRLEVNFVDVDILLGMAGDQTPVDEIVFMRELIRKIAANLAERLPHRIGKLASPEKANKLIETWFALYLTGKKRIDRDIGAQLGLGPNNQCRIYKLREVASKTLNGHLKDFS